MNESEIEMMEELTKYAEFFELHHKTSFIGYRHTKNKGDQEVYIDILDAGPQAGNARYSCTATSEDGKVATGNSGPLIETVIATVHWYNLDK